MQSLSNMATLGGNAIGEGQADIVARSPVLAAGQRVIGRIKLTTGVGVPETGIRFGESAERFRSAGQALTTAFPDDSWDSAGATAYAGRIGELVGRLQSMVDVDERVAGVLAREAEQIITTRDGLDRQSGWLGDMSAMASGPGVTHAGLAAQTSAELAMVTKAIEESTDRLTALQTQVEVNAAEVRGAVSRYAASTGDVRPDNDVDEPVLPAGALGEETAEEKPAESDEPAQAPVAMPAPVAPASSITTATPGVPSSPATMSGNPTVSTPQAAGAGATTGMDVAGAVSGVIGSILGPLAGVLGGIAQAAGQAAQIAGQVAQASGQTGQPAGPIDVDGIEEAAEAGDSSAGDTGKDRRPADEDRDADKEPAGEGGLAGVEPEVGPNDDPAGEGNAGPAMTLPPDLEAASAAWIAGGPVPVHVATDLEHGQLRPLVTATLERGIPGSAAALIG